MSLTELITSAKILIDADGNKEAVLLNWPLWEELLALLEDLEDAAEMEQARQEDDELIPWEQVVADYKANHPEFEIIQSPLEQGVLAPDKPVDTLHG